MKQYLLEYNEKNGAFHENYGKDSPDTYGWESIAFTDNWKAAIFCYFIDIQNGRRKAAGFGAYKTAYVRHLWRLLSMVFCEVLSCNGQRPKAYDLGIALARLGHQSFSECKEEMELLPADEYNPLSYHDANFF